MRLRQPIGVNYQWGVGHSRALTAVSLSASKPFIDNASITNRKGNTIKNIRFKTRTKGKDEIITHNMEDLMTLSRIEIELIAPKPQFIFVWSEMKNILKLGTYYQLKDVSNKILWQSD